MRLATVIYAACILHKVHYFEVIVQNNVIRILGEKVLFPAAVGFLTNKATVTAAVLRDIIRYTLCK